MVACIGQKFYETMQWEPNDPTRVANVGLSIAVTATALCVFIGYKVIKFVNDNRMARAAERLRDDRWHASFMMGMNTMLVTGIIIVKLVKG